MNKTKEDAVNRIVAAKVACYDEATDEYLEVLAEEIDGWLFQVRAHIRRRQREAKKTQKTT